MEPAKRELDQRYAPKLFEDRLDLVFMAPTYVFIACLLATVALGVAKAILSVRVSPPGSSSTRKIVTIARDRSGLS